MSFYWGLVYIGYIKGVHLEASVSCIDRPVIAGLFFHYTKGAEVCARLPRL